MVGQVSITVEEYALGIWQSGSNNEVWDALWRWPRDFNEDLTYSDPEAYPPGETPGLVDVAAELLERIRDTGFTVGDLTNEQVIEAILRRYPILGPYGA